MGKGHGQHCQQQAIGDLLLGEVASTLMQDNGRVVDALVDMVGASDGSDHQGLLRQALDASYDPRRMRGRSLQELLGGRRQVSEELALSFMLAVQMRRQLDQRWTREQIQAYVNACLNEMLGGPAASGRDRVGAKTLTRWMVLAGFDPPWEPATLHQRPGELVGSSGGVGRILQQFSDQLERGRSKVRELLEETRAINRDTIDAYDAPVADEHRGISERFAEATGGWLQRRADQIEQAFLELELSDGKDLDAYLLFVSSRTQAHQAPEGMEDNEAFQVLHTVLSSRAFQISQAAHMALDQANSEDAIISGKGMEQVQRAALRETLGITQDQEGQWRALGRSGFQVRVLPETGSTEPYDLVLQVREPGAPPMTMTLQYKSYQDGAPDGSDHFFVCTLGDKEHAKAKTPRAGKDFAREICRRFSTDVFSSIGLDPQDSSGRTCPSREALQTVYRANSLHPDLGRAIVAQEASIARQLETPEEDGSRRAQVTGHTSEGPFAVQLVRSADGKVSLQQLPRSCWVRQNTYEGMTALAARAARQAGVALELAVAAVTADGGHSSSRVLRDVLRRAENR